jgi:hypothetical protein
MSARHAHIALELDRLHSATLRSRPVRRLARAVTSAATIPLRALPIGYRDSTVMRAVLEPIPSPAWLVDAALAAVEGVVTTLAQRCEEGLHLLPNRNLVTGVPSSRDGRDRRTLDAMLELEARRQIARTKTADAIGAGRSVSRT